MADHTRHRREQILTVLAMYVGYACFMVLRTAPISAGPSLIDEGLVTKTEWGKIMSFGTIGAIVGKFITGWMADRFGGKFTFTVALFGTALAVAAFAGGANAWVFGATLSLALMAKSAGWPSMANIIGNWFRPDQYGRVWGVLSTSSRVGTIVATLGLGALLAQMSWRSMLVVAGCAGAGIALYCAIRLRGRPSVEMPAESAESPADAIEETKAAPATAPHALDGTSVSEAARYFLTSSRFWWITGSLMGLAILWDFLTFVPIYLQETLEVTNSQAVMAASAFPVGSFVSVLIGGYVFDKLPRGKMAYVMGGLLAVATLCIATFYWMPDLGLSSRSAVFLSLALLFVFGLCVAPCYYLPMSVFSIEFGGPHCGILIAVLDALGFAAFAVFSYFGGALADVGWGSFLLVLLAVSAWSTITTFFFLRGEARAVSPRVDPDSSPTIVG